jgi:hypothetical protein
MLDNKRHIYNKIDILYFKYIFYILFMKFIIQYFFLFKIYIFNLSIIEHIH